MHLGHGLWIYIVHAWTPSAISSRFLSSAGRRGVRGPVALLGSTADVTWIARLAALTGCARRRAVGWRWGLWLTKASSRREVGSGECRLPPGVSFAESGHGAVRSVGEAEHTPVARASATGRCRRAKYDASSWARRARRRAQARLVSERPVRQYAGSVNKCDAHLCLDHRSWRAQFVHLEVQISLDYAPLLHLGQTREF
jgi:hypothetical protein